MKFLSLPGSWLRYMWAFCLQLVPKWGTLKRWAWLSVTWPALLWREAKKYYQKRYRNSRSMLGPRSMWPPQLIFIPLMFVPLFLGAVIGLDAPILDLFLTVMVGAVMVFVMLNTNGMLLVMFVLTFLIQGSAQFFGHIRQAPWLAVGMAGLFFMRALLELTTQNRVASKIKRNPAAGAIMVTLSFYLACYAVSFLINRPPVSQLIGSTKAMMPMFGVLAAMYWFHWGTTRMEKLWKLMLVITVLQLPVVTFQHFVTATKRAQGFDSVVGTFGGQEGAGGLSAIMVVFVVVTLGYALARWNRGLSSKKITLAFIAVVGLIILLGEVKASFVWIPIVCAYVLRKRVLKNIFTVIAYGMAMGLLLAAVFTVYNALYWGNLKGHSGSLTEKLDKTSGYFFDTRNIDYTTGEVSRGASLGLWAADRGATIPRRLIGYGPGASKTGGALGKGEVARRFEPLAIDATTAATLLWDTGILGMLSYSALLVTGMWTALRFLWSGRGSEHQRAMMEASVGCLIVMFSMLIYNRALTDEPTLQLLFLFTLGTIVQCARYPDDAPPLPQAAPVKKPRRVALHPYAPRRRPPVVYPGKLARD